jgi:hypothetical protein
MSFCGSPASSRGQDRVSDRRGGGEGGKEKRKKERGGKKRTNSHSELIIGKQHGHEAEEVFIVLVKKDGFDGDVVEYGLDGCGEFAFDFPRFLRVNLEVGI